MAEVTRIKTQEEEPGKILLPGLPGNRVYMDVKKCPFCRSNGPHKLVPSKESYYVRCRDCKARTTTYNKPLDAVIHWNRR